MNTTTQAASTESSQSDLRIYGRLLSYVVPYWAAFLLSIFGFLLYSISNVSFVQLIAYIVDSLQPCLLYTSDAADE